MTRFVPVSILCTAAVLSTVFLVSAADKTPEDFLPMSCAPGWAMEGKVATYTPENLYRYINGEAELYLPYGFKKAATVRYVKAATSSGGPQENGMVVNIFEMGSPLDAFGIYSNYRSSTLPQMRVGAEGFLDETELMFYQDVTSFRSRPQVRSPRNQAYFSHTPKSSHATFPVAGKSPGSSSSSRCPAPLPSLKNTIPGDCSAMASSEGVSP